MVPIREFQPMCYFPRGYKCKAVLAAMMAVSGLSLQPCRCATVQVPTAPPDGSRLLGLRAPQSIGNGLLFSPPEAVKGGLDYGIGVEALYDSNFFLAENHPTSELTISAQPRISYSSNPEGGAPFSFTASYQPNIHTYLNHPDLNGADQSGGASIQVAGAKTLISAYLNYITISGTDRLSGTFTTGTSLAAGISATYQIAPRTSLFANWNATRSDYGSSSLVGSDSYSVAAGGYWSATERFSFGPSIRYDRDESANTGTRDAWAVNMQARYLMGTKLQFVGSLGVQTSKNSRDDSGWQLAPVGGLAATYAINDRLQWQNSIQYSIVPSTTEMNYMINNLAVSTALTRQLLRASVTLGVEMNFSNYAQVGTAGSALGNERNLSAVLSYHRKLFSDRLDFDSSIRYSANQGRTDWSQLLVSLGIELQF